MDELWEDLGRLNWTIPESDLMRSLDVTEGSISFPEFLVEGFNIFNCVNYATSTLHVVFAAANGAQLSGCRKSASVARNEV
jgi:hypothetical protein